MAIKFNERYPGRSLPASSRYPQGGFKNRSAPDSKDGTYLEQDWANDISGFLQWLLVKAEITANGTPDDAINSQYASALLKMVKEWQSENIKAEGYLSSTTDPTTGVVSIDIKTQVKDKIDKAVESGDGQKDQSIPRGVKIDGSLIVTRKNVIGFDGRYKNLTAQRSLGTTYTNQLERSINVIVSAEQTTSTPGLNHSLGITMDGSFLTSFYGFGRGTLATASFTVPSGSSFRVDRGGEAANSTVLTYWGEV